MASHFNFTFNTHTHTHNIQDTMCQICFPDHSSLIRRSTLLLLTPSLSSISLAPLLLFIRSESIHLKMSDHRHMQDSHSSIACLAQWRGQPSHPLPNTAPHEQQGANPDLTLLSSHYFHPFLFSNRDQCPAEAVYKQSIFNIRMRGRGIK